MRFGITQKVNDLFTDNTRYMIIIKQQVWEEIIAQARREAPEESCGYLIGNDDVITENYKMENIDHSSEHFSFAPKDQFSAIRYVRSKGLQIIGNWHSHPVSPSRPSEEDLRLANDPDIRYFILSLANGDTVFNAFTVRQGKVVKKEEVTVE